MRYRTRIDRWKDQRAERNLILAVERFFDKIPLMKWNLILVISRNRFLNTFNPCEIRMKSVWNPYEIRMKSVRNSCEISSNLYCRIFVQCTKCLVPGCSNQLRFHLTVQPVSVERFAALILHVFAVYLTRFMSSTLEI